MINDHVNKMDQGEERIPPKQPFKKMYKEA